MAVFRDGNTYFHYGDHQDDKRMVKIIVQPHGKSAIELDVAIAKLLNFADDFERRREMRKNTYEDDSQLQFGDMREE